ncbi:putative FMN-binding regulatory protein PaiB [Dyadobacter sp. BE34]|uniref:FMN-binding regulatory protein PaiB n=1 Tax=Dyadobacter fermentans TaxID=94254 RepID=A0ABU1QWZ6_9BACT|nr:MULTISPECIES: DinB family protein [Dyadobacter]MDR6805684.1 putative FMN-binding regulatory protein PaiB [Dyadobacter fermentans]MDR7042556.1 putative FMN-binding regulatory protein PaiB [Dyadobacter sp. BE242]MDR7196868.1 putative FMN-binding regulatory protein PaiB [Dyadobacter sp. BE34]MDR7215697.1 putative FMN-binding regulatory protein PaiB [Dyadobacter sp. BE31]MDR7263233.1 putative FMN-binding regulatory protein PaiB [Dyadobacter sp. BE32]
MNINAAIDRLNWLCDHIPALIQAIPAGEFESKPAPEKWSKKEILGHLIDSAANNHQRFIRIQSEDEPVIFYNQNDWVGLSRYNLMETEQVIATWKYYNLHLAAIAKVIPTQNLSRNGVGRDGQKHTLKWYFDDYVDHMEHHLRQIVTY